MRVYQLSANTAVIFVLNTNYDLRKGAYSLTKQQYRSIEDYNTVVHYCINILVNIEPA